MRSLQEVDRALELCRIGLATSEVARRTGIPRSTIRDWRMGRRRLRRWSGCPVHDASSLDEPSYAYLLGLYLGDGCISAARRGVWRLRVTLDTGYPEIIGSCVRAVEAVAPGRAGLLHRRDCRATEVSNYWKHWICLFPQHGPGRKHTRPIVLTDWQLRIVSDHTEPFLRGLIHSDGTRIVAMERKGRYVRRAPRYVFSNRSEDILELFRGACRLAGVHCTRSSAHQVSVYSKAAVARLDEFVGPKR